VYQRPLLSKLAGLGTAITLLQWICYVSFIVRVGFVASFIAVLGGDRKMVPAMPGKWLGVLESRFERRRSRPPWLT